MDNLFFDKEAEKCVLSMSLKNKQTVNAEIATLRNELFTGTYRLLFEQVKKIITDGKVPDEMILDEYFRKANETLPPDYKGFSELLEIGESVGTTNNLSHYEERLKTAFERRTLRQAVGSVTNQLSLPDCDMKELRSKLIFDTASLDMDSASRMFSMADCCTSLTEDIENKFRPDYQKDGIDMGFPVLDELLDGLKKGSMVLVGARPSMGKTSLALSFFRNTIKKNIPAGFLSLEMPKNQLMYRLLAMETGLSLWKLNHLYPCSQETLQKVTSKMCIFGDSNSFIVDCPNAKLSDVESYARMLVLCKGVKVIFIDYAGLINLEGAEGRLPVYEQASIISKRIKTLARQLNIPVVLLVQLNRDAQGKAANMANIRGSGSYEQDADVIIFIQQSNEEGYYLDVVKNRNGATKAVKVDFNKEITLYSERVEKSGDTEIPA